MDNYAKFLEALEETLGILLPRHTGSIGLSIDHSLYLQIEEASQDYLRLAFFLTPVPPGPFRSKVIQETLKENHFYPSLGILAYCTKNEQLVLTDLFPLHTFTADTFCTYLELLIQKAFAWKKGVEQASLPPSQKFQPPSTL